MWDSWLWGGHKAGIPGGSRESRASGLTVPLSYFTAIYNFQGSGAPQLTLQIGDVVRIQETCGGESSTHTLQRVGPESVEPQVHTRLLQHSLQTAHMQSV
jgi:hypothetical protein